MIPKELQDVRQWSYSYSSQELKRPTHIDYKPGGALSYVEAKEKAGNHLYTGFYVTASDPYILGDIDHIPDPNNPFEDLPIELAIFIQEHDTYYEVSPSGKGLRFILKFPDVETKEDFEGQYFKLIHHDGQVNIGRPWMTITGEMTPFAYDDKIGIITSQEMASIAKIRTKETAVRTAVTLDKAPIDLPHITDIRQTLFDLPIDENPRVKRAYLNTFGTEYEHYDYWLKILMALHNYSMFANKSIECLQLAIEWSKQDERAFTSEEDVEKRWRSFSDSDIIVSYKTLYKMYYSSRLKWPVPKKQSKDQAKMGAPLQPLPTEYRNFKALVDYYDIKLYRDEIDRALYYITADQDIIDQYFMMYGVTQHYGKYYGPFDYKTLTPAFHIMCQEFGFLGLSHDRTTQFLTNLRAQTKNIINMVRVFFDTPFDKLPAEYQENKDGPATFDEVFDCLRIDYVSKTNTESMEELKIYKKYYKAWWMGFIRNLYFQQDIHTNNCVLLLTGKEQIRKTSHFKYLLPTFLREHIAFTTHGFASENSVRDVAKISATSLMIVWDELEQYLNSQTESNFKKIIDNNPQKMIDKYEVSASSVIPKAIYGATSNQREFRLGNTGSRRLFHIPVTWVKTTKLGTVNWHKFINDLKKEVSAALKLGEVPWLLTEDELEQQVVLHKSITSSNTFDIILSEIFDTTKTLPAGYTTIPNTQALQKTKQEVLMTTKEVIDIMIMYGTPPYSIKRPAVIKSLQRLCGNYTRTQRGMKHLEKPKCVIYRGQAEQGPHRRWITPPIYKHVKETLHGIA